MSISHRRHLIVVYVGTICFCFAGLAGPSSAQTPTFIGIGQLPSGSGSRCYGVSPDGTMVTGEAVNSSTETVAILYDLSAATPVPVDIGFLDPVTNRESKGRGVAVNNQGTTPTDDDVVYACGIAKNSAALKRGFFWSGNRAGIGSLTEVLPVSIHSDGTSEASELLVAPSNPDLVYVVGTSYPSGSSDARAFRWRSDQPASFPLNLGVLRRNSRGYDIGYKGETVIVGWSDSTWGSAPCSSTAAEAFHWTPSTMYHDKGLDYICGGEPWQISAGPDGEADTGINADNVQVVPVGTTGLSEPDAIVISAGPDNRLKDQLNPSDDDIDWPVGHNCDDKSWSVHRGISGNGRYRVGASSFPEEDCGGLDCNTMPAGYPRQAHMRDVHNRDDYLPDNCGGIGFLWPLGHLPGDNCSEALAVSNGSGPDKTNARNGLAVVGWSRQVSFDPFQWANESRAFVCFIKDQDDPQWNGNNDLWFLRHQDAEPGDPGASAASQFKDMKDLKVWLEDQGIDMTGWELREATSVSDDGRVIVGWGVHDGTDEGFIVTIEPPPPPGACCIQTGWGFGTCMENTTAEECVDGTWLGPGTSCNECDFCPDPFADTDRDGDVDQDDFSLLQACVTGPMGGVPEGCECFDRDSGGVGDGDIDEDDVAAFESCASGPDVPLDPGCEGP